MPLIGKRLAVIQIDEQSIRLLVISKVFNQIKIRSMYESSRSSHILSEEVKELAVKYRLANLPCALLLPISSFELHILDIPDGVDAKEISEWIDSHFQTVVHDFQDRDYRYFNYSDNDGQHVILQTLLKNTITEYLTLFQQASMNLVYLGSGLEACGIGLADDPQFNESVAVEGFNINAKAIRVRISNGQITEIAAAEGISNPGELQFYNEDNEIIDTVKIGIQSVSVYNALLYGVALDNLLGLQPPCDLLPESVLQVSQIKIEKKKFQYLSLILLSIFFVLLIIAKIGIYTTSDYAGVESDKIVQGQINQVKIDIQTLQKQEQTYNLITNKQERVSSYMEIVGRAIPSNLWLKEWSMSREPDNKIELKGRSLTEASISKFVDALTQSGTFADVKLNRIFTDDNDMNSGSKTQYGFEISIRVRA